MKKALFAIFVAAVLIPVSLLSAQTKEDDYAKANTGVKAAEIKMEASYTKLVADIRAKNEKGIADGLVMRLEKSQKAWQAYREAQVEFVVNYYPVPHPFIRETYRANYDTTLIEARTQDLLEVPNPR